MKGWIKLHRSIQNHWLYQEKRVFSRYEAWLDMLMMANHKDNRVVLGNEFLDVRRGQFITSIRKLCDKWGWSKTKVTQFLKMLESDERVVYFSDTKKTVITIGKYGFYQAGEDSEKTEEGHLEDTEETRKSTNKNGKETKKEIYTPQFDEFWSVYPRKVSKTDAAKAWNTLIKFGTSIDEIITATRSYAAECQGKEMQFIKYPSTFLRNDRWKDHLTAGSSGTYKPKEHPSQRDANFSAWVDAGNSPDDFDWS